MALGAGSGALAISIIRQRSRAEEIGGDPSGEAEPGAKKPENLLGTLSLDPISVKCGRNLVPLIDLAKTDHCLSELRWFVITLVRNWGL